MSTGPGLALAALLILGNGFFVGVEFALLAARRTRLSLMAATSRAARTALAATERLPEMIAACQFGITLCSLGLGAVAEPTIAHVVEPLLHAARIPAGVLHPLSFGLALAVVSALHMLLGEMVPKNIALAGPEGTAVALAPALVLFDTAFRPVVRGLNATARLILRLLRIEPVTELAAAYTPSQVAALVSEARREGLLDSDEHDLLSGALHFGEKTAEDVVLLLPTLVTVPLTVTPADIEELVGSTGFSRFPVLTKGPKGEPELRGYIHLVDVLETDPVKRSRPVQPSWVRPLATVRETAALHSVLETLQRTQSHMGKVVTEGGATLGVVTLEDVLEVLVGEVRDSTRQ